MRDSYGRFCVAVSGWCEASMLVYEGEAFASWKIMDWVHSMGMQNVIFESDSKDFRKVLLKAKKSAIKTHQL